MLAAILLQKGGKIDCFIGDFWGRLMLYFVPFGHVLFYCGEAAGRQNQPPRTAYALFCGRIIVTAQLCARPAATETIGKTRVPIFKTCTQTPTGLGVAGKAEEVIDFPTKSALNQN